MCLRAPPLLRRVAVCKQPFCVSAAGYFKVGRKRRVTSRGSGDVPINLHRRVFLSCRRRMAFELTPLLLFSKHSLLFARKGKSGGDSREMSLDSHITKKRKKKKCTDCAAPSMIIQKGKWSITANNRGAGGAAVVPGCFLSQLAVGTCHKMFQQE